MEHVEQPWRDRDGGESAAVGEADDSEGARAPEAVGGEVDRNAKRQAAERQEDEQAVSTRGAMSAVARELDQVHGRDKRAE